MILFLFIDNKNISNNLYSLRHIKYSLLSLYDTNISKVSLYPKLELSSAIIKLDLKFEFLVNS